MPALRAASNPISTAPVTEVSASVASGEYRQPPQRFFFCAVAAQRIARSRACAMLRTGFSPCQSSDSSTMP
jgi:hypothetical protein